MPRALLVGVRSTDYRPELFPELPGVAEDIQDVSALLRSRGFDVTTKERKEETTAVALAESIARFVDGTQPGDLGVLYLAGHGYRVRDSSGDEIDSWDEAFMCSDAPLLDDWFRKELWPRARPRARFAVLVDACHSDTMVLGLRPDSAPPPIVLAEGQFYRFVLAACRDEEITRELAGCDRGGGVVTTQMLDLLKDKSQISYAELGRELAQLVADRYNVGTPHVSYRGPDDSFLNGEAFAV
jgi:hypothetical protein